MPELPEVETIRRDLSLNILHKKIVAIKILNPGTVKSSRASFSRILLGNKFVGLERIGKLLIFSLSDAKHYLLVHLKMTGQLIYQQQKQIIAGGHSLSSEVSELSFRHTLPNKSTRIYLVLADQSRLFFNDQRKFGYWKIVTASELQKIKAGYGLEPLTPGYKFEAWKEIFANRRKSVKGVLLDQKLISGVGNIYADEVLFLSGLHPKRPAGSLKPAEIKKLFINLQTLIKKAIKYRGTTFNNYVDGAGKKGNFVKLLQVYGRFGKKCFNCGGLIQKLKVAGRGTNYCPKCQK